MSTEAQLKAQLEAEAKTYGASLAAQGQSLAMQNSTVAQIAGSVSTAREAAAQYAYYLQFSKGLPNLKGITPDKAKDWAVGALESYALHEGKKWGADVIKKVASAYGAEGYVPTEIPTNEKEAVTALTDIACTAASSELGIDPRIAKVTVEAVIDGKLDKHDAEAIGSLAGSIAGAAACQMFGIPAPIGAFLGGELGGFIGGEIADIFGASRKAHREWLAKQRKIVAEIHTKAEVACGVIREGYWNTFDAYVASAEVNWEIMELKAGALFDVRWFGKTPGYGFAQYLQQQASRYGNRIGAQSCDVVCFDGSVIKTTPTPYTTSHLDPQATLALWNQCREKAKVIVRKHYPGAPETGGISVDTIATAMMKGHDPVDRCGVDCLADYGCLYPDMSPYTQYPTGVRGAIGSGKRVCSAYYALGFPWLAHPPSSEVPASVVAKLPPWRITGCTLPEATAREVSNMKARKTWTDFMDLMIRSEEQRISNLNSASVRLFGDLAQTAATVAVQRQISDSKTMASLSGLSGSDSISASSWINNGALVAGLGWLAYNSRRR